MYVTVDFPGLGECTVQKALSGKCRSCGSCKSAIDCSELGHRETELKCVERGCMWCPNNMSQPVCRYGSSRCKSYSFLCHNHAIYCYFNLVLYKC